MSGGSAGPAGVKNLRAMFENKSSSNDQSNSPPSRGRSPNGSISSANSRPVSKVRTSFVAVERPGEPGQPSQWGLRKTSDVSSMAEVREEGMVENGGTTTVPEEVPVVPASDVQGGLGAILKGSAFENTPVSLPPTTQSETKVEPSSKTKASEQPKVNGADKMASEVGTTDAEPASKSDPVPDKGAQSTKPAPSKINTKPTTTKSKESPTIPKKSPVAQKDTSSNGGIKPRGGVNKIQGIIQSSNKAKEERAKAEQAEGAQEEKKPVLKVVKPPSVASKPTAASKAHAQKQDSASPEQTQAKSPTSTRAPVKLPSAATALTAAAAARKGANTEKDESKPASSEKRTTTTVQAPRVAHATTRASLAKKISRTSLTNGEDRSRSRLSTAHKPADESFLARMTRPTASSAQKAHDKVQVSSPPRQRKASEPMKSRKSLNVAAQSAHTEPAGDESVLEAVNETAGKALEDTTMDVEGEPGPAEEHDPPNPPQQAAVAENTV
ncbi:hypothetical protein H2198_004461 [Neophaeococcomyces mojaviensis]|uniref:Uncharacterized protein n=1 Tax=Neophaeococcomyces mojaviensis TaxID=3383035 RepID=A0ACC3A8J6_9EURO|nr:hypothetical protein H2198_004461 [Knufia sp. JES_112]